MQRATIKVAYVDPPAEGKKMGSIKTDAGVKYRVWPDKLHNFKPGEVATIDYEENEFMGKPQFTVKAVLPNGNGTSAPAAAPSSPTPAASRPNGNNYRETSQRDAERMFVCGAINAGITSGQLNPTESVAILDTVTGLREVWRQSFGKDASF